MRILLLDIETAPNRGWFWGMWDQNIGANQVEETGYVLCWSAKWLGDKHAEFESIQHVKPLSMLKRIHKLLDEADVVIHYNGTKFDIPTLNREFIKAGLLPPSPYKQLDLLQVVRRMFRFERNSLGYVSIALKIGQKVKHEGFELWVKCMRGDAKAWAKMERYNRGDIRQLERLYKKLRPWIARHPNMSQGPKVSCPKCASTHVQHRGTQVAVTRSYPRYQCQSCGGWFRGTNVISKRQTTGVNIT